MAHTIALIIFCLILTNIFSSIFYGVIIGTPLYFFTLFLYHYFQEVRNAELDEQEQPNNQHFHTKKRNAKRVEVCFTGFSDTEKAELISIAREANIQVRGSVTMNLDMLVCGNNAGPSKIKSAQGKGISRTNRIGFEKFIETGEI